MSNFSVTVTTILGTDSMNNSRVTINNNFKTLADSINNIAEFFPVANQFGSNTLTVTASTVNAASAVITNDIKVGNGVKLSTNGLTIGSELLDETKLTALLNLLQIQE